MKQLLKARAAAMRTAADPFRPKFHAAPLSGWMNDPNGLIWSGEKAHLFYQCNPYAPKWGRMHWGHMVSTDLVRWEHLPVALAPDQPFERLLGCFSGSAIEHEGRLHLLYTGVSAPGGQQQCLAVSLDGVDFIAPNLSSRTNSCRRVPVNTIFATRRCFCAAISIIVSSQPPPNKTARMGDRSRAIPPVI